VKLFEPGRIGKLDIKNRIVMAPMGVGGMARSDGTLSERGIRYYTARAKGGAGLIITGLCRVDRTIEALPITPFVPELTVDNKIYVSWLDELARAAHDYGAKIALQLSAGEGRILTRQYGISTPAAPSSVPWFRDPTVMTRELTISEIEHLIRSFEFAAEVIGTAGIDAIELHCHGGYLLDQFLTALWNKRNDRYGGNLEGRMRFLLEIVRSIKKVLGTDFPLIVEYGLTHYLEGGREIEEGLEIARRLEEAGVDALSVDGGSSETIHWMIPSEFQPPGCSVALAEMVKKVVAIPVIVSGKLGYPALAEEVLQDGKSDFIALGRALLADPEWPNKAREGRVEEIRPCIGCFEGCRRRIHEGKALSCAVNPATGQEKELAISLAEKKKSVVVIGGGPGGMEAARVAALRGHCVTLVEKGGELGGNLIPASVPVFKRDYRLLIRYLALQIKKSGVEILLRKEATAELIEELNPDVVIVATGGSQTIPDIPGVNNKMVVNVIDLLLGRKECGKSVIVIGGGTVACEFALYVSQKGSKVTIVEIMDDVANTMYYINRMHLLKLLEEARIRILTNHQVLEIADAGVTITNRLNNISLLSADTIALASGMKASADLLKWLRDSAPEVYPIGDCVAPRNVMNAMWEGHRIARII
jgi:2-enoate reductase